MISISLVEARRTVRAVESALRAGFPAPGATVGNRKGAIAVAAAKLGVRRQTVQSRVEPGGACEAQHGLKVDWTVTKGSPVKPEPAAAPPADPVELRRLRDGLARVQGA